MPYVLPQYLFRAFPNHPPQSDLVTIPETSGSIIDTSGNLVYDIHANFLTLSSRCIIRDSKKKKVGQIKRMHMKSIGIHDIWYLGDMDDVQKCSVRCTSDRHIKKHRHKFTANICKGETVIGDADVKWTDRECKINLGGKLAATVTRKADVLDMKDSSLKENVHYWYGIKVEPGVDQVFMVLVVMGLNEIDAEHPESFM